LLLPSGVLAQEGSNSDGDPLDESLVAAARAEPAMRTSVVDIDGVIDETAWAAAPLISGFIASEPTEGIPAGQDTNVRVLFDDNAIYVSARMWEQDAESVRQLLVRRDERGPFFDWFGISIDPDHDRRTGYAFRVSAAGVQQDLYISDDWREDTNWDAVWESAVTVDSLGWTAELRIPLSQIRYEASGEPQTWGVNFHRRRVVAGELSHFALESRRVNGIVSQFGTLHNVLVPEAGRRIEARPYVLTSMHTGPAEADNPFFDGSDGGARFGSDFRFGLGSAFTLDATVNPDFGQVEADPAEINLSAFETFFEERRPFFVEGAEVFDFTLSGGRNQLFYSRRIGRAPQGDEPDGSDEVSVPDAATIIGAAKMTGRTTGGLSLGALTAVTQAETGEAFFADDGSFRDFRAEPRTEYGVITAQQDFNGGASQFGGIVTALRRDLPSDGQFDFLTEQAYSAGMRFDHQWDDRRWNLNGFFAASHVRGSPEAILEIQEASNHYYQRPDATGVEIDSTATSLTGAEWRLQLERQNTEHWSGSVWLAEVTNGFEINDLGFSGSRERLDGGFRFGYRDIEPGSIFRDYNINLNTFYNFSHEALDDWSSWDSWRKAYTGGSVNLNGRFTLLNYHGGDVNFSWRPDQYSRSATRGGPIMMEPGNVSMRMGIDSDRRQNFSFNVGFNASKGARDSGGSFGIDGSVNLRPSSRVSLRLQPRFDVQTDGSQYVTSTSDAPYAPTFGARYFFGELERKTATLEARVNYTFSPTLSLQLFAQGLLSSGDYVSYKQLLAPSTYDFRTFSEGSAIAVGGEVVCVGGSICQDAEGEQHVDLDEDGLPDYSFGDRDFNVRSLIGNAVLRWEYRPGSTIFLVWQRAQRGESELGTFDFGRDLDALWGAPADNRFILKVNYWLGL
jgi:hypothetical protein